MNEPLLMNLYLDFKKNHGNLNRAAERLRERHPTVFEGMGEQEEPLTYIRRKLFPEGLAGTYFVSNTSLKEQFLDFTVRPKVNSPSLQQTLAGGNSIAIRGHLASAGTVFVVDRLTDIHDSPPREFETEATVRPFTEEANVYAVRRENVLFTPDFIAELPEISKTTGRHLKQWHEYLEWKRQIVMTKLYGVRYQRLEIVDSELLVYLVFEHMKAFQYFKRIGRREQLMLYPLDYSTDPWKFRLNERKFVRGNEIGDFKGDLRVASDIDPGRFLGDECTLAEPVIAIATFDLTDEAQNELANVPEENYDDVVRNLVEDFSQVGFLATSSVGDFALIRRQKEVLDKLQMESGHAPFLSSWLFDIQKANLPKAAASIERFNRTNMNEDQRKAVEKMLTAPDIFMMQGPPGTGKTTVIAEAVYQLVCQGQKVLLSSQANLAVDNVFERLANEPQIRAIRLGKSSKISDEGKQFAEDRVLEWFYSSIATNVESRLIGRWKQEERRIAEIEQWLEQMKFGIADYRSLAEEEKQLQGQAEAVQERCRTEERRYQETVRRQSKEEERRKNLHLLVDFLDGRTDQLFVLEDAEFELLWQSIAQPLLSLRRHHIDLSRGSAPGASSRSSLFMLIWTGWQRLLQIIPKLERDLEQWEAGGGVTDADNELKIQQLSRRIDEIGRELEEDESKLDEWRTMRSELRKLKEGGGPLLDEAYGELFNMEENGTPRIVRMKQQLQNNRHGLTSGIRQLLQSVWTLHAQLSAAVAEAQTAIHRILSDLVTEPVDDAPLRRLEAERTRLESQSIEKKAAVEKLHKQLVTYLQREMPDNEQLKANELMQLRQEELQKIKVSEGKNRSFKNDWRPFLEQWKAKLDDKQTARLDHPLYIDTYVNSCNVVGVTCTENAKILEQSNHTVFDVAIIDEVSKATPPELLMPMIRSKRSILVGDHRQLPPLFKENQSSYEEMIKQLEEEQADGEDVNSGEEDPLLTKEHFDKYKYMVTASLFKEYFENADVAIKESLLFQYRMHPDIMEVINHFYENRLKCGLMDADKERAHGMVIRSPEGLDFIRSDSHAVWIDSSCDPTGKEAFETQDKTSKINELEAVLIVEMLQKMDRALGDQAAATRAEMGGGKNGTALAKKDVGVISFYGRQVREIRNRLKDVKFEHLNYEINTVDRFQGKEKSIVIVSMVRNKKTRNKSKESFVAAFQRINVAFSRARELLVVVGAKSMFYDYDVELPLMDLDGTIVRKVYRDILDRIHMKGNLWDSGRVISSNEYSRRTGKHGI